MGTTARITLGGVAHTLRQLNIGQIERVTELFDADLAPVKRSFALIPIVLECVEPPVADAKSVRASVDEIAAAIRTALRISGLAAEEDAPNPPPPPDLVRG